MDKRFWAIIGIIVVAFVGFMIFQGGDDETKGGVASKPTSNITGKTDAKVTLQEWGDFQCPFCAQYYPIVEQVKEKYKDQIAFQFSHLPLTQIHPNAYAAARAAEAAGNQGKFWEMYDLLYQNQQTWSAETDAAPTFKGYAGQLKLDTAKFNKDFASSAINAKVNADKAAFKKLKIQESTPVFLLNGKQIKPTSVDEFSKLIDEQLKKEQ